MAFKIALSGGKVPLNPSKLVKVNLKKIKEVLGKRKV